MLFRRPFKTCFIYCIIFQLKIFFIGSDLLVTWERSLSENNFNNFFYKLSNKFVFASSFSSKKSKNKNYVFNKLFESNKSCFSFSFVAGHTLLLRHPKFKGWKPGWSSEECNVFSDWMPGKNRKYLVYL